MPHPGSVKSGTFFSLSLPLRHHWLGIVLADLAKLKGVEPHCPGVIDIGEGQSPWVGNGRLCYDQGDLHTHVQRLTPSTKERNERRAPVNPSSETVAMSECLLHAPLFPKDSPAKPLNLSLLGTNPLLNAHPFS